VAVTLYSILSLSIAQPVAEAPALPGAERVVAVSGGGYFPVMVRAGGDNLLAVVRGGAPHLGKGGRLDLVESADGGRTWSAPHVVVDSEWDDRNPAFGRMPDGTLVVAYAECRCYNERGEWDPNAGDFVPFTVASSDGGRSWSEKQPLETPFRHGLSPYGRMVTLADGTVLMSIYGAASEANAHLFTRGNQKGTDACGILRSTDNGRTWGDFSGIARGYNETAMLALADGKLVAFARSDDDQHTALLESSDGGRKWTEPVRLTLAAQHPADAALLPSGEILLVYGSRVAPYGVHVARAREPGELAAAPRWAIARDSTSGDQGYPSVVALADGRAVVVYYAVGNAEHPGVEMALAVRFDPAKIGGP
jgi:hypothetical protein